MKELLKKLGLNKEEIDAVLAETPPDGFNIDDIVTRVKDHDIQVYEAANPRMKDEDVQGKVIAAQKDLKYKFAQILGLSETRGNIEKMPIEDFYKLAKEKKEEITTKIDGDEKLKAQLNDTTQKLIAANQELENVLEGKDAEIARISNESKKSIQKFKLDSLIEREAAKVDWGIPKAAIPAQIKELKGKIEGMIESGQWTVADDGSLSGINGVGIAISFDQKSSFKTLDEVINKEFEPLTAKSTGTNGKVAPTSQVVAGIPSDAIKSDGNKKTLEWLEQAN